MSSGLKKKVKTEDIIGIVDVDVSYDGVELKKMVSKGIKIKRI